MLNMQDSVMTSMYRKTSHLPEHAMLCEETSGRVTAFYHDRVQEAWGGRHLLCGRPLAPNDIQLMSNDYLDLSSHEEVVASQCQALRESGNGLMMSGIYLLQGNEPQRVLEDSLAEAFEAEAVVLCQSGYAANVAYLYRHVRAHVAVGRGQERRCNRRAV
jgi:CAI-1 autoinducer synthase